MGLLAGILFVATIIGGCSGQSGSDRECQIVPGSFEPITDRIALAQCGDGSVCIGACGGTQDSGNTTDVNNPVDSNNRTTIVNPTPTPERGVGR
jgi:hypothetical protein